MDPRFVLIFLFGLIGGALAFWLGAPLPFMLGGIVGAAGYVLWYERDGRQLPKLSRWVRLVFIAIIGTMIGSRFSPELLGLLPQFWISGLAIIPYILIAQGGGYAIMRGLGGYPAKDAYFAALPGGIVDSVTLAEQAGADVRVVTAQHFIRIILVVGSVPLLFLFIDGHAVGSMGGQSIAAADYDLTDVLAVIAISQVGLFLGRWLRIPVSHMMGPLVLALVLSITGVVEIAIPGWLQHLAQYMVGTALGAQFSGISRRLLVRGLGMGVLAGAYMLALAAGFAYVLEPYVPADFSAMFVSFAAGGLAEMSLIALSLHFNPIVVALHHLARIFLTIWIGLAVARRAFDLKD